MAPLLHSGDKDLEEIQQIVMFTEVANLAKRAVGTIADLTMMAKKKQPEKNNPRQNDKCFNCTKKGHYNKDCHGSMSNKKKPEELLEKAKRSWWKKNQDKVVVTRSTNKDNSNAKPYLPDRAFITCIAGDGKSRVYYLDSSALRHICNSHERFIDLRLKTYEFVIASGDIIRSNQVGIVMLPLKNDAQLTLSNVTYNPKCDFNLIFLDQL